MSTLKVLLLIHACVCCSQSFHNLMTAYAPKRIGYKHDGYVVRMEAAYIDHNSHLDRPQLMTKDGKLVFTRKWSKRSARWHDVPVPYPYAAGVCNLG